MSTDRLTVTVPKELGEQLRALASERDESVSSIVAEAIAHELRRNALDDYLDRAKREGRWPSAAELDDAGVIFDRAEARAKKRRRAGRVA